LDARAAEWQRVDKRRLQVIDKGAAPYRFVDIEVDGNHRFVLQLAKFNGVITHHDSYHEFSVLHFSYLALRLLTNASEYLTQHDVLALMIASLCHDADHPGNTNHCEFGDHPLKRLTR
jgi:hypothetical protein